jgi:hypothetical protein
LVDKGQGEAYYTLGGPQTASNEPPCWLSAINADGGIAVCWHGQRLYFHVFLRQLGEALASQGFTIFPYASQTSIKAISLKLGKREWLLCDAECVTGTEGMDLGTFAGTMGADWTGSLPDVSRLYHSMLAFQRLTIEHFGVGLKVTAGSAAIAAMSRFLPDGAKWWPPNPLLSAFCRIGGAYRGGYSYGTRYHGLAWKVDINKAYTAALGYGLPLRGVLGTCLHDGKEADGVYLCRVEGRGEYPAYISTWRGFDSGFHKQTAHTFRTLAYLPQAEFAGLRVMGYAVTPLYGFRFTSHLDLSPFTARLAWLQSTYARGTAQHAIGKAFGNSVVGKLAQGRERTDVCYASYPPDTSWHPFITTTQDIVPYLWARTTDKPASYHHIDAATVITARVRNQVYNLMGAWQARGGSVYHVDTDGAIISADPNGIIDLDDKRIGAWRNEGFDSQCTVIRAKCYVWQGKAVTAGVSGIPPETIELALGPKIVTVGRAVLHVPWLGLPQTEDSTYSIGPTDRSPI